MAKSSTSKKRQNTKSGETQQPRFHPMTVVSCPSMVVDANGVAWWIDTEHNSIRKARTLD